MSYNKDNKNFNSSTIGGEYTFSSPSYKMTSSQVSNINATNNPSKPEIQSETNSTLVSNVSKIDGNSTNIPTANTSSKLPQSSIDFNVSLQIAQQLAAFDIKLIKLNNDNRALSEGLSDKSEEIGALIIKLKKSAQQISSQKTLLSRFDGKLVEFEAASQESKKSLEDKVKEFDRDIINSRNASLGIVALFASFFSFISVSINIFSKDVTLAQSVSIILILWMCLISFIYVFMAALVKGLVYFSTGSFLRHACVVFFCICCALAIPRYLLGEVKKQIIKTKTVEATATNDANKLIVTSKKN